MIRFESDYAEGAHPNILESFLQTNEEQTPGYGMDDYCKKARTLIGQYCGTCNVDIHFLVGGTQTNAIAIAAALRPYQGVISANTGHISEHETGAIEASGHKVLTLESPDGKVTASQISLLCETHWNDSDHEHTVQPGMVYLSFPTENGTLYTKQELISIKNVCNQYKLFLYVDGARLGYGVAAPDNDVTIEDLTSLCDAFYIGGTKVGALFGEALVISNPSYGKDFRYIMKQRGGMLAKGRLLGLQFEALFEDGLYFTISKQAVKLALQIKEAFANKGYSFLYNSPTNQQFPILPNTVIVNLSAKYSFKTWKVIDQEYTAVRFCTSWCTKKDHVEQLLRDIGEL